MKPNKFLLAALTAAALAACGGKAETSVPAANTVPNAANTPVAAAGLVEGSNYTVLPTPIPQKQAGKVEVLEFFGYFCPHCAHLEPVLSEHTKTFKDDTYLRTEHVVWSDDMKPLARLTAALDMTGEKAKANSYIFDALVNQKIELYKPEVLKKWLSEQTAFDGKKVLAAYESPQSTALAEKMAELTNTYNISGTPTVIVGGKYQVEFADWQSGMKTIDLLIDKVRKENQEAAAK